MYRSGEEYNTIERKVADIYCDYEFRGFPVDEKEVCSRMGVRLQKIPLEIRRTNKFVSNRLCGGFFVKSTAKTPPTIFYEVWFTTTRQEQRFAIFHELKHFVFEDKNDDKDDLAEHFSRCFMCPPSYFLLKGITAPEELADFCDMTFSAAKNASQQIKNRLDKYGTKLYSYEVDLIRLLEPALLSRMEGFMEE